MKNLIKVEREKRDITQAGLAEQIQVSRQTINAIEKGKFIRSTMLALKMARFFECPVEAIFSLEEND